MKFEEQLISKHIDASNSKMPIVYFLIENDEVVYVGQSKIGINRIFQHNDKDFDNFHIINCKKEDLNFIEKKYILKYRPKHNKTVLIASNKNKEERVRKTYFIKKSTADAIKTLAKQHNRTYGQQVDVMVEYYVSKYSISPYPIVDELHELTYESGITKTVKAETQGKLNEVFKGDAD